MSAKMPFRLEARLQTVRPSVDRSSAENEADWTARVPELANDVVTLREVRRSDAPSLFAMLTTPEVCRYMSTPPPDVAGFERFIEWAQSERCEGRYICFAVVPRGYDVAIGILQVRQIDPRFDAGEWGAALGSQFWGTGIFAAAADLLFDFLFDKVGVHRLEARAAVQNGRANGAARKVGSVPEGLARQALKCDGRYHDQLMWSLLAEDWRQSKITIKPVVH
jgi:[ribosomal protein S5]-alanine N-acetyltransferase